MYILGQCTTGPRCDESQGLHAAPTRTCRTRLVSHADRESGIGCEVLHLLQLPSQLPRCLQCQRRACKMLTRQDHVQEQSDPDA